MTDNLIWLLPVESRSTCECIHSALYGGETASEVVLPFRNPSAQVSDPRFAESVFSEVVVGEDADAGEVVQDCFQVEVRVMTAGEVLKIDAGEGAGDGVQVDDVADHEAVMPARAFSPAVSSSDNARTLAAGPSWTVIQRGSSASLMRSISSSSPESGSRSARRA